jgi:lathosterol oxidase
MHKIHHKSTDVTPFSGFAFHPLDAFGQAIPTFVSCFFFPLHYNILMFFSLSTTIWAISIHDNVPMIPIKLFLYSTHHTIHHEPGLGQYRNYGKFTTIWDRLLGTYQDPDILEYGWMRSERVKNIFTNINFYIDKFIPDRTVQKIERKLN